ncbi:MAG TPA: cellulase family glycosylhydrolase [Chloroflexota bacterium]|nr:cellulase family glycosylhydrolase [Chloroflexota bacterium]
MSRLLTLFLSSWLLLGTACSVPTPPSPPASPLPKPAALASPPPLVGGRIPTTDPAVHVFLWGNSSTTARDLQLARNAGFQWVKQRFEWRYIEGKSRGNFEWNEPDRIVDAISQSGLRIIARVDNQPQWASSRVTWPGTGPPDDPQAWSDFLTALATRYKGRIQAYEIWNEPNLDREWGDAKPDAVAYTSMLKASYAAIKAADPQALVVSAGMSPTTTNNAQAIPDLEFIRQMYAAGAKDSFDVLGVHAAGYKAEPCADPAQVALSSDLTNNDPSPVDLRRIYAFRHVEDVRDLMVQQGDANKQMSILEMGWTTDARPTSKYAWFHVDRDQQARNLVGAFQCARQLWEPWMGLMTVIYIPDPGWTQQEEQYWWSITNPDGMVRPAYTALRAFFTTGQ